MQTDGIIPRPCRLAVTEPIHEPTHEPQLPQPALGLLWKCSPHHTPPLPPPPPRRLPSQYTFHPRLQRKTPPASSLAASNSVSCPIAAAAAKSEAKTRPLFFAFHNATVARPCRRSRTGSSGAAAHASQKARNSLSRFEGERKCTTGMLRVGWLPHGW
jgi:hypothetical protein